MTQRLSSTELEENLAKIGCHCPREDGDNVFFCISRDHKINVLRDSVGEIPSPKIAKVANVRVKGCIVRATELNKKAYMYHKFGKNLCHKLGQPCFITNYIKHCYKLWQLHYYKFAQVLLQTGAAITK